MEGKRTHDKFYLKEDYKSTPKEYYKLVQKEIDKAIGESQTVSIIDIGCETGSFLHFLRSCYPCANLTGIDIMQELLEEVNKPVDIGAATIRGDISDFSSLPDNLRYDVVSMLGVIGIFDDYKVVIDNLMKILKDDGTAFIFGVFNPEDVDMLMRCRYSEGENWEKGWNVFSQKSISHFCEEKGWDYEWIPFSMPFEIPKHSDDPLRSYTINAGGQLLVVNGLQLIHNFFLLKISKRQLLREVI